MYTQAKLTKCLLLSYLATTH